MKMPGSYEYSELNGKQLRLYVVEGDDGTVVVGKDERNDIYYILIHEVIEEIARKT